MTPDTRRAILGLMASPMPRFDARGRLDGIRNQLRVFHARANWESEERKELGLIELEKDLAALDTCERSLEQLGDD